MSFWDTVGAIAKSTTLPAVFDAARVASRMENPEDGPDGALENAKQFGSAFFKNSAGGVTGRAIASEPVQATLAPFAWAGEQASHGFSTVAAMGGMLADSGQTGIDTLWSQDLWSRDNWSKAWEASEGVSGGEAMLYSQGEVFGGAEKTDAGRRWWDPEDREDFDRTRREAGFRLSAGALDIISTWYADPTIVVGKAAKVARAGNRIVDAAQADDVADAVTRLADEGAGARTLGDRAAGAFSSGADETASRLWHNVVKTDNMGFAETAAHFKQNLERSGDAGPIIGILGQASKITDLNLQRQVKADTLLAAAGSQKARDRLITTAPHIARAVQRASLPPESYQIVDDMVAAGVTGESLLEAAGKWASKENTKELQAYAKELDAIHTRLAGVAAVGRRGGVENVGTTALGAVKSKYRAGMAREFFFQPGPHSRTVRVVHWATGQRSRGVVATDDAVRGHDELMDWTLRSKLFTAQERKALSDKWWQAPNKAARSDMAQAVPEIILNKLATKHGLDRDTLKRVTSTYQGWAGAARTYTTKQMEAARAANGTRVVLEDPVSGVPTSIDRALFETHIENNVGLVEVDTLERLIRHAKGEATRGDKLKDSAMWALNTAEDANDVWRTLTLARPGFMARTQFDTQARSAMTIGATAVIRNAMKGLGHKMTDKLKGEQVQQVEAMASDLLRQENLRREAAELRRQAGLQSNGSGKNLLDRAAALEAEAAEVVTYDATARRLVTKSRTLKAGDQEITTRAAASDAEVQGIIPALHTGEMSISDAILRTQSKLGARFAEDANNWVTTLPEDIAWNKAWLRSKDAMMRSKAGKAILDGLDLPDVDMIRHLRNNPDVKAAWREVRDDNPHFDSWLDRAIAQVEWTAPTREVREALKSGRILNEDDVDLLFKPAGEAADDALGLAERMPVHAPAMDVLDPRKHGIQSAYDMAKRFVRWMSDQPDTVLGRVPMYTERYFTHFKELAGRELDRSGEIGLEARARMEEVARHRAIQDVRQTMYDTARFTGAHDRVARMGFAFLGAWEDSMRAWGKMFYDDPSRVGKLAKIWYAPERGGLIVDENGNPVRPGQEAREKWIALPVGWIPGVDFQEFKIRKDSFNSMFQGDVPWAPGFAPGVQIPATQLAARVFPDIADPNFEIGGVKVGEHPLLRQLFGFGLPKTGAGAMDGAGSVLEQSLPGWMRRAKNIIDGDSDQFTDAYAMALNTEMLKARAEGKDPNSKAVIEAADKAARGTARSMMMLEFVSNYGLGLSGEGSTKADFYRMRYREISKNAEALYARGSSPMEEMVRQHPEVAGLKWSFSENETGINASLKVENRSRKFGKDIQKNPEFGWFYVGSDNIGGEFSAASYAAQFGREGAPGSGDTWRSKMDSAEILKSTSASLGWDQYYKVKDEIDAELKARGLHSLQQKGAEDLADVMKTFREELSAENPEWGEDYNSFDGDKMQSFLQQVAYPATQDGRLKNRSDIKAMSDYLALREEAMAIANENGYSLGSRSAADLRAVLLEAGAEMAQENLGFSQMWQRVFSREIDLASDDFPATPSAGSATIKF